MERDNYYKSVESLLYNYTMFKASIENMEAEIKEIEIEDGLRSLSYENEKTSCTNEINRSTENIAIRKIEHKDLLKKRIEIIDSKLRRLDNAINALNELENKIITKRYFEGKQWYIIAYELSYNERWCRQVRKQAISKLAIGLYGDIEVLN
ncbi:hypothetical protein CLPU_6c00260 [Gottschalkia purinilytica]|uniref:Uncharacterized protein n=1 Tax=Gottschalkia purinilytica TaxID=1503 RepID=A0A0L0WB38_GOTPU|nr:hypothetical protein [Gottschalkia purinilytica]KNF08540.1 hypothetical protein CLPU_6c00260 [Gottschalkia purinilytica]